MDEKQLRLDWQDVDWAKYLGCSVQQVQEYKEFLNNNFVPVIEHDKKNNRYSFAMYRYHTHPSGHKSLQLMSTRDVGFATRAEAIDDANSIISCMEFTAFWEKMYNMPKRAIQMMLIREK